MRLPAQDPGSCQEGWSPSTESGLQACYGKSPGNGAFSIVACCPEVVVVSVRQPFGGLSGTARRGRPTVALSLVGVAPPRSGQASNRVARAQALAMPCD